MKTVGAKLKLIIPWSLFAAVSLRLFQIHMFLGHKLAEFESLIEFQKEGEVLRTRFHVLEQRVTETVRRVEVLERRAGIVGIDL